MKKTLSTLLIISFLFNTAGYLFIFLVMQSHLKENLIERISSVKFNTEMIKLSFSQKEFSKGIPELKFFEEDEFSYKGKMYDVVKTVNKNDTLYFYCLADPDEDELNLAFNSRVKDNDGDKNSSLQNIPDNILYDGILSEGQLSLNNFPGLNYFSESTQKHNSNYLQVPTLPPVYLSV